MLSDEDRAPIVGTWPRLYALVLGLLAFWIAFFAAFTAAYRSFS
jgi:hypothetical protein